MYESQGFGNDSMSEKCKEPDWEAEIAHGKAALDVIERFHIALIDFIGVIGKNSFRRDSSSIPELLGTVSLDIMDRKKTIAQLLKKLEG